jgi:uncharacterized protein YyaL (SSP411 family)
MRPGTAARIIADLSGKGLRENYWDLSRLVARLGRLTRPENRAFRRRVVQELGWYLLNGPTPIRGEARERARAAADWLFLAQDARSDDGVAQGYFPCDGAEAWRPSYPETTGYIITSLLQFAERYADAAARERALRMARWEIDVQMESGAVQAGTLIPRERQVAAIFNTGMVLDGWATAYGITGDARYLEAGDRAADFLVADLGEDGHFRSHGSEVTLHRIKTYNCLCAWALYRHGQHRLDTRYRDAAIVAVEAAVGQQTPRGWLRDNCLTRPEAPLLHTIGYALQGILEVGVLAGRSDFVDAAVRGVDPVLARMKPSGFLHGRFYEDWEPAGFSSCLTGSAQLAVVCYRLQQVTGSPAYRAAADRIVDYLKPLQALGTAEAALNGALGGSFPLFGSYMTAGYPNWATKYLLDALMLQDALEAA